MGCFDFCVKLESKVADSTFTGVVYVDYFFRERKMVFPSFYSNIFSIG